VLFEKNEYQQSHRDWPGKSENDNKMIILLLRERGEVAILILTASTYQLLTTFPKLSVWDEMSSTIKAYTFWSVRPRGGKEHFSPK
jgi:hypothetical protein